MEFVSYIYNLWEKIQYSPTENLSIDSLTSPESEQIFTENGLHLSENGQIFQGKSQNIPNLQENGQNLSSKVQNSSELQNIKQQDGGIFTPPQNCKQ